MKILLTNDDGIDSEGINVLYKTLSADNEVVVIAPHENRSAVSHHVIMNNPIPFTRRSENMIALEGFPADCVITGVRSGILEWIPDVIVAGINKGANLGTDIIYSGTCGAARQGALYGIPSVAVSLELNWEKKEHYYGQLAQFVADNIEKLKNMCGTQKNPDGSLLYFVSVNALDVPEKYKGVKLASFSYRDYGDRVSIIKDDNGKECSKFLYGNSRTLGDDNCGHNLVQKGYISLTLWYTNPVCETDVSIKSDEFILK